MDKTIAKNDMSDDVRELVERTTARLPKLLELFIIFSRMEYALKRCGYLKERVQYADSDWERFAGAISGDFDTARGKSVELETACAYLFEHPPRQEQKDGRGGIVCRAWDFERTGAAAIKLAKQVRNNLFHGGKFPEAPHEDPTRDANLIDAALIVLVSILQLPNEHAQRVRGTFRDEA